jgi:hypothetical protein
VLSIRGRFRELGVGSWEQLLHGGLVVGPFWRNVSVRMWGVASGGDDNW